MQRYTVFFITVNAPHLRRFLRPSSGAQNCIHSIWYVSSLLAATASGSSRVLLPAPTLDFTPRNVPGTHFH
jgi:hypothetical protein